MLKRTTTTTTQQYLIDTISIATMVNTMLTWRIENPLQWAQLGDSLCVDPELIQQVVLVVQQEQLWREEQRQRHIVGP
jgi:hypothetical protein